MKEQKPFHLDIYEKRDEMGRQLYGKIQSHPQEGQWKEGFAATSLMLNSASHPDGKQALSMVIDDAIRACNRQAPADIIKFSLEQVVEWRRIVLKTQERADGDKVVGKITMNILERELKGKLPGDYFNKIFLFHIKIKNY